MPPNVDTCTIKVNGRTYTTSGGTALNVPDFDAVIMKANGWTIAAGGGSGASTARPSNPSKNTKFADTTLGVVILWDGKNWRNPITGATA
jgi:hypothetical protein